MDGVRGRMDEQMEGMGGREEMDGWMDGGLAGGRDGGRDGGREGWMNGWR